MVPAFYYQYSIEVKRPWAPSKQNNLEEEEWIDLEQMDVDDYVPTVDLTSDSVEKESEVETRIKNDLAKHNKVL